MAIGFNRSIVTGLLVVGLLSLMGSTKADHPCAQVKWEDPVPGLLKGEIQAPKSGTDVPRQFYPEGIVSGQARHLWLVERIGALHWPKEPEIQPSGGKWQGEVNEGGRPPDGRFDLLLVDVSDAVAAFFKRWLQDGHRTGNYPGFPIGRLGADVRILDTKSYRLSDR